MKFEFIDDLWIMVHLEKHFAFFKHLVFVAAAQLNQKNYNQHKLWSLAIRIFG